MPTRRFRVLAMLAVLSLAATLVAATVLMTQSIRRAQRGVSEETQSNQREPTASSTQPAGPALPSFDQLATASSSDFAALQPGGAPLDREPANLTSPAALASPPAHAARLAGIKRRHNRFAEEVAVWSLRGVTVDTADRHYAQAARDAGFAERVAAASLPADRADRRAEGALSRTMTRTAAPPDAPKARAVPQTLIVSIRPAAGDELRVTLWLRYPIMQP